MSKKEMTTEEVHVDATIEEEKVAKVEPKASTPSPYSIERRVVGAGPRAIRHPNVRGGICDFCGVVDKEQPSEMQHRLCKHYAMLPEGLFCTYCPEGADRIDIVLHRKLTVYELADRPGELIVHCDDYNCRRKHLERFTTSA